MDIASFKCTFSFIGFAFNDSPVGLAAYLLEKISTGTNIANKDKPGEVHVMCIVFYSFPYKSC